MCPRTFFFHLIVSDNHDFLELIAHRAKVHILLMHPNGIVALHETRAFWERLHKQVKIDETRDMQMNCTCPDSEFA